MKKVVVHDIDRDNSKKNTIKNVRKHKKLFKFVEIIIRDVKSTMMLMFSQIYFIYNELKLKFRRDLIKFTKNTTMNAFLQKLNDKKK